MTQPFTQPFFACASCSGMRQRGGGRCVACGGYGNTTKFGETFLVFREHFTRDSVRAETVTHIVERLFFAAIFLFGLFGAGILVWLGVWQGFFSSPLQWISGPYRFLRSLFWLSLLGDAYLFYRISLDATVHMKVERQQYMAEESAVPVLAPYDPAIIRDAPASSIIDLFDASHVFVQRSLRSAWRNAERSGAAAVEPIHVLTAILEQRIVQAALTRLGVSGAEFTQKVQSLLERNAGKRVEGDPDWSIDVRSTLFFAYEEAYRTRQPEMSLLEVLIALSRIPGEVQELFFDVNIDTKKLRDVAHWFYVSARLEQQARRMLGKARRKPKHAIDRAMTAIATPFLDQFGDDITQRAKRGMLLPCVGRRREIDAIFRILETKKASVILVGAPGVGKTKIIEGIAERIIEDDVPALLQEKRIVALSIPALLAGAASMGEPEERFVHILSEAAGAGNVVLFIDNIHQLVGAGSEGGATFDLSSVLAEALESGSVTIIATTTVDAYTEHLERHGALSVVTQKVDIAEMNIDQTLLVLEAKVGVIEYTQQVYFLYDALRRAADLSARYMPDRFLPDKAIKLIEEVAIAVRKKKGKNARITGEDVAAIVAERTNVPVTEVTQKERDILLHLEERMHERIIGQDEAVRLVARALKRARAELRDQKRPIANFLFLGPTGVGKTELAKTVAEVYFGDEKNMIRLDMSEYQEAGSMSRLLGIGGRAGSGGGQLTEAVRKRPFALLLLDEIEKAHPDILNVFLQVMDDGRLTDASGRTVDFTNTIIIGTSNAGAQFIQDAVREGMPQEQMKTVLLNNELRSSFRPEFLNRFDGVVVFTPLTLDEIIQITKLLLKKVAKRLEGKGIAFQATDEAIEELAKAGFDPLFGARPLRRAIQERVDDALANALLEQKIGRRDIVILEQGGAIRIEKAEQL